MGYIRNKCIVVSGWGAKRVSTARDRAIAFYAENGVEKLVGELVPHAVNGGAAFLIAPDGSKEGWGTSDQGDAAEAEFIAFLKGKGGRELYLEWAHILIGGDDGEYRVLNSPNGAETEAADHG